MSSSCVLSLMNTLTFLLGGSAENEKKLLIKILHRCENVFCQVCYSVLSLGSFLFSGEKLKKNNDKCLVWQFSCCFCAVTADVIKHSSSSTCFIIIALLYLIYDTFSLISVSLSRKIHTHALLYMFYGFMEPQYTFSWLKYRLSVSRV